ncbi:MAG: ATP-binding protein [Planctomycetota bacterium]
MTEDQGKPAVDWGAIAKLAGGLAHEIKNPLSTINVNLQLLEEEMAEPQTAREKRAARKVKALRSEVQRLSHILEDFLRFMRLGTLELEPTDLNDLAAEIVEFVEPKLARLDIRLRKQFEPDLPTCLADPRLLKQAILNVILNAQEAMPEGGELILRTSSRDRRVTVDVIDTGPGVSDDVRDRMFDAFFSTKEEGSGLGLALTRQIIDQHGGDVELQSELGKGTHFVIRLPAHESSTEPEAR